MEEVLDLMPDVFTQKELEDLAALHPELQHLHICCMLQSATQVCTRLDKHTRTSDD